MATRPRKDRRKAPPGIEHSHILFIIISRERRGFRNTKGGMQQLELVESLAAGRRRSGQSASRFRQLHPGRLLEDCDLVGNTPSRANCAAD